jgi:hypothetical protein
MDQEFLEYDRHYRLMIKEKENYYENWQPRQGMILKVLRGCYQRTCGMRFYDRQPSGF